MKLPPHFHSDLMALVVDLEDNLPPATAKAMAAKLLQIKNAIASVGVKTQAPSGHFYSPVVNPNAMGPYYMRRWQSRANRDAVEGVDIGAMRELWSSFVPYMQAYSFQKQKTEGHRYFLDNIYYGISDASILVGVLNHFKPSRYFEIGSGFSSALALDVAQNASWDIEFRFVEPYPEVRLDSLLSDEDRQRSTIEKCFVQEIPLNWFQELNENDILFIDSTHVAKSGSDVIYLYLEILNLINKGVVVHVHDIFFPFDYPPHWVINDNRSWNEAYILRAFLLGNDNFEVLFFNDAFGLHERELIRQTYPSFLGTGATTGGSIWLRKSR